MSLYVKLMDFYKRFTEEMVKDFKNTVLQLKLVLYNSMNTLRSLEVRQINSNIEIWQVNIAQCS